jgi:hypothetical protein
MAERADWLESAAQQAALEPQLAWMVLTATAATRVSVATLATVQQVRMGRFSLQTVRPAAPVAMAGREA